MKLPSLIAAVVFSALVPAIAVTDAEITPAALAGKTLTFTIETAGGAFADTGTWTGTFGNPAFTVTKLTGNTVNIATTHSTALSGFTIVTLPKYVEGSGVTTIALYTSAGIGRYEMNFSPVDSAYQIGTFTIGAPVVRKAPEINVLELGNKLKDGRSKVFIPSPKVGETSNPVKLVIRNSGTAKLTGLGVNLSGADKARFRVSDPAKTSLAPGETTSIRLTFKPTSKSLANALLSISSNDKDENPFDIKLQGSVVRLIDDLP